MLKQDDLIPVERLVFVCKNLDEHFKDARWNNFSLSPLTNIRGYVQSRYVIFNNLMLEFLELIDETQGHNFAFFEEWKKYDRPAWVGVGLKVDSLERTIAHCLIYQIKVMEKFISTSTEYAKGFKHRSSLMDFKIQNRSVYFTEYDKQFESERNQRLFGSAEEREKLPSVEIRSVDLSAGLSHKLLNLDVSRRVCLNIKNFSKGNAHFEFDWIVCTCFPELATNEV